jgi:hypothetical protein
MRPNPPQAIPPTQLHGRDARDSTYHGHSFDSFYHHFGVLSRGRVCH